jgi:hypothetical protein
MKSAKHAKRVPIKGVHLAAGLALAVPGVQALEVVGAVPAYAADPNWPSDPNGGKGPQEPDTTAGSASQVLQWLQRNIPVNPEMVPEDAKFFWSKKLMAYVNQELFLDPVNYPSFGSVPETLATLNSIGTGVNGFFKDRVQSSAALRNNALGIIAARSDAITKYVTEAAKGPVSPETFREYLATTAAYSGLPAKYQHLETNDFVRSIVDQRYRTSARTLKENLDAARTRLNDAWANGTPADEREYEFTKAVEVNAPTTPTSKLRSSNYLDYQLAKYGSRLPSTGGPDGTAGPNGPNGPENGDPDGRGPLGGPKGNGPDSPRLGNSGGDSEESGGRTATPAPDGPQESKGSTDPVREEGADPNAADERTPSRTTDPSAGADDTTPAPGKTTTGGTGDPEFDARRSRPGTTDPSSDLSGDAEPSALEPEAPKFTPSDIPEAGGEFGRGLRASIGENLVYTGLSVGLDQANARMTSSYLNWLVKAAYDHPNVAYEYLRQYSAWLHMNWAQRRIYEAQHFFDDDLQHIDSSAFTPQIHDYMLGLLPAAALTGDRSLTPDPYLSAEPYRGGATTGSAVDHITRDKSGNWHDKSKLDLLLDRTTAPGPAAPKAPDHAQTPAPAPGASTPKTPEHTQTPAPDPYPLAPTPGDPYSATSRQYYLTHPDQAPNATHNTAPAPETGSNHGTITQPDAGGNRLGDGGHPTGDGSGTTSPSSGGGGYTSTSPSTGSNQSPSDNAGGGQTGPGGGPSGGDGNGTSSSADGIRGLDTTGRDDPTQPSGGHSGPSAPDPSTRV